MVQSVLPFKRKLLSSIFMWCSTGWLQESIFAGASNSHTRPMARRFQGPVYFQGHILEHFFPTKMAGLLRVSAHSKYKIRTKKTKRHLNVKIPFSGLQVWLTGLWDFTAFLNSRQIPSKNKRVCEKAVIRVHGSWSLLVMGSWWFLLWVWVKS